MIPRLQLRRRSHGTNEGRITLARFIIDNFRRFCKTVVAKRFEHGTFSRQIDSNESRGSQRLRVCVGNRDCARKRTPVEAGNRYPNAHRDGCIGASCARTPGERDAADGVTEASATLTRFGNTLAIAVCVLSTLKRRSVWGFRCNSKYKSKNKKIGEGVFRGA